MHFYQELIMEPSEFILLVAELREQWKGILTGTGKSILRKYLIVANNGNPRGVQHLKFQGNKKDAELLDSLDLLGTPPTSDELFEDLKVKYLKAKLRKDEALADQYEFKVLVAKRKLIDPAEILEAYKHEITVLHRALQSVGGTVAPLLRGETNQKKIQVLIDSKINNILERLGKAIDV